MLTRASATGIFTRSIPRYLPQHQERLKQVQNLTPMVENILTMSTDELEAVEAAASVSEADATRFAINSALLAVPELTVPWASIDRALETISLRDRHQALVAPGGASTFFEQAVQRERELQQAQLKAAFSAVTDGLMMALAPHLAELGVSIDDKLQNGQHIVASVLQAASAHGMEQLEAIMANPKELARQAAAVKVPAAMFGLMLKLVTDSASFDYGMKLAQLFEVSPMQIEHQTSRGSENIVELQV